MTLREKAGQIARDIARDIEREFGNTRVEVESVPPEEDGEVDAYLWLETDVTGDEAEEIWDWVRYVCNLAWQQDDVKIVWRWKRNRSGTLENDDE